MLVSEYGKILYELLKCDEFLFDKSLNGFQIECPDREIKKVAFAVDAAKSTFLSAVREKADLLVVHHGLFWGAPLALRGSHYERVKIALDSSLSLFAAHLPLDGHPKYGNNAEMARILDLESVEPFGRYHGKMIGCKGRFSVPVTAEEVAGKLGFSKERGAVVEKSGKEMNETVAIVSGNSSFSVYEALEEGIDLFITGNFLHEIFYTVKEERINVIAGGHYATETFGVKALEKMTREDLSLDTVFIDAETGL